MSSRPMHRSTPLLPASLFAAVSLSASIATAGIHTWDVKEVFSNASGTIQYIELIERQVSGGAEVGVGSSSITSATMSHSWTGITIATPTAQRSFLIASQTFADLPGAPVPDVIIPVAKMPFFNPAGDTLTFALDGWAFGAVPTNGQSSLDRDSGVGANTPRNYAGAQGNVNASPAAVPTASFWMTAGLVSMLAAMGAYVIRRRAGAIG